MPSSTTSPVNLTGSAVGFTLNLSWQNPVGPATPRTVLLDVAGAITTTIPLGPVSSFAHAGVPPGIYTFSVRAVTPQGISASSNPVTLSFPGGVATAGAAAPGGCSAGPQLPTQVLATRDGHTVTVRWQPPAAGQPAASYILKVTGSYVGSFATVAPGLSGAVAPGSYTLSVQALNACGASALTTPITIVVP